MKPTKGNPKVLSSNLFPVVGIGASAGGLDAFKRLIGAIPEKSGMAYILVQHLDPKHESVLPELLQKVTSIPVHEISDNIHVKPDHIYIIPPNKVLEATDGILQLTARPDPKKRSMPIDIFFSSLAEVHQAHAIGIVLSGTQTDGTQGLKSIKEHGGATFAQDTSSEFGGMPANAIAAGVVDFILPPEQIPQKLAEMAAAAAEGAGLDSARQADEDAYSKIISLLTVRKGNDFTYYKQSTIRRRILRRMAATDTARPADYLEYLKNKKSELDILYQELLIPVTSFFRDAAIFDKLCQEVIPKILKQKPAEAPVRIWVAGCSTGQEVYSMAICLHEYLGDKFGVGKVKIFGSDISEPAIATARAGAYKKSDVAELSATRLKNNFSRSGTIYTVNKAIREVCVFAVHNFLADPPFPKMDVISCRNVLIYLEPHLQKRALTTFHYALSSNGVLLLGKSETVSSVPDLFTDNSKPEKLFYPKDVPGKFVTHPNPRRERLPAGKLPLYKTDNGSQDFQKLADDILLSKYAPPGVIVNEAMDIVYFRGDTSAYLAQAPGKPSHNLMKMARNDLAFEVRNLMHKAAKEGAPASKENIPAVTGDERRYVTLEAIPLPDMAEAHYLLLFHDAGMGQNTTGKPAKSGSSRKGVADRDLLIQQLEQELALTREDMRSITEDQEAINEELQSTNEELSSGGEELESLNEELQTSKEELQGTNEELTIVNQEMISLNEQITAARNYSETIVGTIHEPLLVLDAGLRIKTANAAFYKTFGVTETETEGALIFEMHNGQWNLPGLLQQLDDIRRQRTKFFTQEVTAAFIHIGQRIMLLNAREMSGENGLEKYILLAMEDITERKTLQQQKADLLSKFQNLITHAPFAICVFRGPEYIIELANEKMLEFWDRTSGEVIEKPVFAAMPDLSGQGFEELLHDVYTTGNRFTTQETPLRLLRNGKTENVYIKLVYDPVYADDGSISGVMAVADEVTDLVMARKKMEETEAFKRVIFESSPDCVKILDTAGRLLYMNTNGLCLLEIDDFRPYENTYWSDMWGAENAGMIKEAVIKAAGGEVVRFQGKNPTAKGNPRWWDVIVSPVREEGHTKNVSHIMAVSRDITKQKEAAEKVAQSNSRYHTMLMQSPFAFSVMKGKEMEITLANNLMKEFWGKGEGVEGKTLLQVLPELKNQPFPDMIDSVFTTGQPVNANEMLARLNHNGITEDRYFNIVYQPLVEADETVSGVITIAHEVTNQVLARKKIEESEHRFQQLIYSSPSLIAILKGKDNIITIANDAIIETWGKGKDLIGKPFLKALPELVEQNVAEELGAVYTSGIPSYANERAVDFVRDGKLERRYFSYVFQPQRNSENEIEGVAIIGSDVTSQALGNIAVKESEERFRLLADQVPMFVFIIEPNEEATISYWNKTWLDYTGQHFDEALGRAWDGIIHPDDVPGVMGIYVPAFKKRDPYFLPAIRVRRHDGEYRWHMIKANPRYMPGGEFMGFIGIGLDVHENKLAEEALKESEQRFRNLVEKATSPICILKGADMILEVANEPVFRIWNIGKEAIGKPFLEIMPEMKDQSSTLSLQDVLKNGVTHFGNEEPVFFNRKNGKTETFYFNFVYQPYRENNGSISGVMMLATDVTEQVVARKKMEAQAAMVKDLLMTAPGFVATLAGPDHVYELVNEQYQSLFGKRKIQGKPIMVALPELEGQGFDTLLDNVYTTGEQYLGIDIPVTLARDENLAPEVRYFNFSYQPVYDENKTIYSILVFGYEVTEQVVAKNAVLEIQQEHARILEQVVADRTIKLKEAIATLHQKNEELQNANQELESFTYVSSHDLQEPLRKIQTFAGRILEKEYATLSDAGKDYFNRMNVAAGRMQILIEDLLAYSHSNLTEQNFEETDLNEMIEEVKVDLSEAIAATAAVVEVGTICSANIVPFQFRQVIHNLISNAIKFSKPGLPPHITISSQTADAADLPNQQSSAAPKFCHIVFSDNGIGFDPQYSEKIFEVFQRLHGKEEFAGTGIGLAIVKKIIKNHNGFITATGELGNGARFDIYLPAK